MPLQPIIPIWQGLNTANSPSATGLLDPVTNQQYNTGGLQAGDYFDLTEKEANSLSNTTVGQCHSGRYRYVQLDAGATAANVKTGTVGYLRAGTFVQNVVITNAGTGAAQGNYTIVGTGGGGSGATIQVVVGSGGTITSAVVVNGGSGYSSVPTFSLTATGTTGGAVAAELNSTPNIVTSSDQSGTSGVPLRTVVFLNSPTPGNYTFIQELGLATVLGKATSFTGSAAIGVTTVPTSNGTVDVPTAATTLVTNSVGTAVDLPVVSNLFKVYLTGPIVQD